MLTRQKLPYLSNGRADHAENACAKGGYILAENQKAEVTLIASGSEVSIAIDAQNLLENDGIAARIVSMPCVELFAKQPKSYQHKVLGRGFRVAIEAACEGIWPKYLGEDGLFIGMNSFGASAPADDLYSHFGITAENITEKIRDFLRVSRYHVQ